MDLPSLDEEMAGIRERAKQAEYAEKFGAGAGGANPMASRVQGAGEALAASPLGQMGEKLRDTVEWVKRLPKNVTLGVMDAAVNTANFVADAWDTAGEASMIPNDSNLPDPAHPGMTYNETQMLRRREASGDTPEFNTEDAYRSWRDTLRTDDHLSDSLTQGVAQFAIPFMAWSRAAGVVNGGSKFVTAARAAGAEAATLATAYAPHDPRIADLAELGRHSEGKLGDVLRTISPDGSLINGYIDYMTDRNGETPMGGRFKNMVDGLVGSVATATLLKTGATTIKAARNAPEVIASRGIKGPMAKQQGKIVFHGSPHEVDKFDTSKIGTGEGAQAHGYGLYFAEEKGVANTYRESNNVVHRIASAAMYKYKNDWAKAVADLRSRGDNRSAAAARALEQGKGKLSGGNLYHVDIPDEQLSKMIDLDKPMSEQMDAIKKIPDDVRTSLEGLLDEKGYSPDLAALSGRDFYKLIQRGVEEDRIPFYPDHGNYDRSDRVASEYLDSLGIPGLRFLDGGSRKSGAGTRNIVLFNDKHAKVVSKE